MISRQHFSIKALTILNKSLRLLLTISLLAAQGTAALYPMPQAKSQTSPDPIVDSSDFKPNGEADGRAWDGTILGFYSLKNSKGEKVSITEGRFMSAEAARRQIADDLRHPSDILDQGDAKNGAGHVVGERAVVTYAVPVTHEKYTAIVWNNGREFHRVASPSPAIAKTFEELIKAKDDKGNRSGAIK